MGIEEQIQRINFGVGGNVKQEEVGCFVATSVVAKTVVSAVPVIVGEEYVNWIFSEDEIIAVGIEKQNKQSNNKCRYNYKNSNFLNFNRNKLDLLICIPQTQFQGTPFIY